MSERRPWRRRTGIIRTLPWSRLGAYYPDRILDGGRDAPLSRRQRFAWFAVFAFLVLVGVVVIVFSR